MLPWNLKPLQIRDSSSVRPSSIPTTWCSAPTPYIRAGRHSTEAKQESEKSRSGFGRKVVFRAIARLSWSVDRFDRDAEHVPGAALRENVARCRRFGLELAPQAHDLRIDRSVVDVVVVQAGHVEKLGARKDAMWRSEEDNEKTE